MTPNQQSGKLTRSQALFLKPGICLWSGEPADSNHVGYFQVRDVFVHPGEAPTRNYILMHPPLHTTLDSYSSTHHV